MTLTVLMQSMTHKLLKKVMVVPPAVQVAAVTAAVKQAPVMTVVMTLTMVAIRMPISHLWQVDWAGILYDCVHYDKVVLAASRSILRCHYRSQNWL